LTASKKPAAVPSKAPPPAADGLARLAEFVTDGNDRLKVEISASRSKVLELQGSAYALAREERLLQERLAEVALERRDLDARIRAEEAVLDDRVKILNRQIPAADLLPPK